MPSKTDSVDLSRFLAEFRRMLCNPNLASEPQLPSHLQLYGEFAAEANRRLRATLALEVRGQYANAVAEAEREPRLLTRCTALEFPEVNRIPEACQVWRTPEPEGVDVASAALLHPIYQRAQEAADLRKLLHKLNLARAPLPTRISVMRRLLEQNPDHPYLDPDLRVHERAWYDQAAGFAEDLARRAEPERIGEIIDDLRDGGYMEPVPARLIPALDRAWDRAVEKHLPTLWAKIQNAFRNRSVEELRPLAERWAALLEHGVTPPPDALAEVARARDWLAGRSGEPVEEDRDRARSRLEQALGSRTTRAELDGAYQAAEAIEAVDDDLHQRYEQRRSALEQGFQIKLALGAAAAVMLPLLLFALIPSWTRKAPNPIHPTSPEAPAPTVTPVLAPPSKPGSDSGEKVRRERFNQLLAKADQFRDGGAEAGRKLDEADHLAATDPEWEQVRQGREQVRLRERSAFDRRVAAMETEAATLLARVQPLSTANPDPRRKQHQELGDQWTNLEREAIERGFDRAMLDRVKTQLTEADTWLTLSDRLIAFRDLTWSRPASAEALRLLADFTAGVLAPAAPDADLAHQAGLAREALAQWLQVDGLRELLSSGRFLSRPIPDIWAQTPAAEPVRLAASYAQTRRERDASAPRTAARQVRDRLAAIDVANLWVVQPPPPAELDERKPDPDPARYYTRTRLTGPVTWINFLSNRDGREERCEFGISLTPFRAPQSIFADQSAELWAGDTVDWEARLARRYDALLETKGIESLLQLELARDLLDLASETSPGFQEVLAGQAGFLKIRGQDAKDQLGGNWLHPSRALDLHSQRDRARTLIQESPRLRVFLDDAKRRDVRRLAAVKTSLTLIGWVGRDPAGKPTLERFRDATLVGAGQLYAPAAAAWIALGVFSADGREVQLDPVASVHLGWPVFAVTVPRSSP